jgi:hypothetical protein
MAANASCARHVRATVASDTPFPALQISGVSKAKRGTPGPARKREHRIHRHATPNIGRGIVRTRPHPYSKKDHIMINAVQANKANIATVTNVRFAFGVIT